MRTLFLRIFLSFWLAMVLVSAVLVASVITTQSQFRDIRAAEFDRTLMPLMAARAADILDDHGMSALADFLNRCKRHCIGRRTCSTTRGRKFSQPTPPEADAMAQSALQSPNTENQELARHEVCRDANDGFHRHAYVLVIGTHVESIADVLRAPVQIQIIRAALVLVIAGVICSGCALHHGARAPPTNGDTSPGAGQSERACGRRCGNRNDELSELSRDFDHMAGTDRVAY